jgi:hypothetical protein
MVTRISPQPLAFIAVLSFLRALEFVGPQQGRDHVAGDEEGRGGVDELDDHAQTLRSAAA